MSRTIALKISTKEEEVITRLNKQGISNSEILRNALRHYFELLRQPLTGDQQGNTMLSVLELKNEMQHLQKLTTRSQEQLEHEIVKLHRQLYQLTAEPTVIPTAANSGKPKRIADVHKEVDEFLSKRTR